MAGEDMQREREGNLQKTPWQALSPMQASIPQPWDYDLDLNWDSDI